MSEEVSKVESFIKLTPLFTAIIAIVGIVVPIAGFSFEQGYLSVFGISGESFPRALNESLANSFYVVLLALLFLFKNYFWFCAWVIGNVLFVVAIVVFILSFFEKETVRKFFSQFENKIKGDGYIGNSISVIKDMYMELKWLFNSLFYMFCILVAGLVVLLLPLKHGSEEAQKHLDEYTNKRCEKESWSRCIKIQDVESNIIIDEGFLVAATKSHVALYDGTRTKVIPRLNNYSLIRYKSKSK